MPKKIVTAHGHITIKVLKQGRRQAVDSLLRYLEGNRERLNYCERLRSGRVIGSGLIEGACKNLVGRRLNQTGACWRQERVNRIAILAATLYAGQWNSDWEIPTKVGRTPADAPFFWQ